MPKTWGNWWLGCFLFINEPITASYLITGLKFYVAISFMSSTSNLILIQLGKSLWMVRGFSIIESMMPSSLYRLQIRDFFSFILSLNIVSIY
jgi:hypothetical protein